MCWCYWTRKKPWTGYIALLYLCLMVYYTASAFETTSQYESNFTQWLGDDIEIYVGGPFRFTCEAGIPTGSDIPVAVGLVFKIAAPPEISDQANGSVTCFHLPGQGNQSEYEASLNFVDFFDVDTEHLCTNFTDTLIIEGNITREMSRYIYDYACEVWPTSSDDKLTGDEFNWTVTPKELPENLSMDIPEGVIEGYPFNVQCSSDGGIPEANFEYGKL